MESKVYVLACLALLFATHAEAAIIINPTVIFTVRNGAALDQVANDGGYLGTISDLVGQVDRSFLDFDHSASLPSQSALLNIQLAQIGGAEAVVLSTYSANGVAELSDFSAILQPVTSFTSNGFKTIDVTSQFNSAVGGFLGFALTMSTPGTQATMGSGFGDNPGVVTLTTSPVPEPTSLIAWSLLGLVGAGIRWRRRRRA